MQIKIPISLQFDLGQFISFFAQLPQEYKMQIFEALKPYLINNQEDDANKNNPNSSVISERIQSLERFKGGLAQYKGYETTKQEWYEQ